MPPASRKQIKIQNLYNDFSNPPKHYSAAPFVFLNNDMDEQATGGILQDLSQKGFSGVVLSARSGLSVPFASPDYWRRLSAIVGRARDLSMFVWICDDYNLPGGTGAGRVLVEKPDFRARGIFFYTGDHPLGHGELIGTYLTRGGTITCLGQAFPKKKCLIASVLPMEATTFSGTSAPWIDTACTGSLDILNPDAVDYYVRTVLAPSEQHLGEFFGDTIVGVLLQAPQNQCPFPWTHPLPVLFKEKYGYDLITKLPCLCRDVDDFVTVRTDYYGLIGELISHYYRSIRTWAESNNLICSGSVEGDAFIENIAQTQGSPYIPFSELNVPGTNFRCGKSFHQVEKPSPILSDLAPKLASSVARMKKHERVLSVMWEGAGWGEKPFSLKRSIDRCAALGTTTFLPHGVHASLVGLRKRDFPPSYYVQMPYWEDMRILSFYISRISLMMSTGRRNADMLVLFPLTSLRANTLGLDRLTKAGQSVVCNLNKLTFHLFRDHRDFDFLFEEMVGTRSCRITDGAIYIGKNRYTILIIPPVTHIPERIRSFIEKAKLSGIDVVFVGSFPSVLGKTESIAFDIGMTIVKDVTDLIHYLDQKTVRRLVVSGKYSEEIVHQSRQFGDANIYFFSNLGRETFEGMLTLSGYGNPEAWDPESGKRFVVSEFELTQDGVSFPVRFQPGDSWIFVIHTEYADTLRGFVSLPERKIGELFFPGRWQADYRTDNMLRIDNFRLIRSSIGSTFPPIRRLLKDTRFNRLARFSIILVRALTRTLRRIIGIGKRIGSRSYTSMERKMRFSSFIARIIGLTLVGRGHYQKNELIVDTIRYMGLPVFSSIPPEGSEYEIEANFMVGHIPHRIFLVWEDTGDPIEIYVNGLLVSDQGVDCFLWDYHNKRADLSDIVRWGTNRIGIKSHQPSFPTMVPALHWVEPVVITGDFDVNLDIITTRKETTRNLSWGKQATGNYSGTVSFRNRFLIPKQFHDKHAVLYLGDVEVACRVTLNGHDLGARLWPPYRYDVTDMLVAEENEIEIHISNTASNLLETPIPSGIMNDPKIVFFDRK